MDVSDNYYQMCDDIRWCSKSQLWDISDVYKEHEEYSEKADFDVL